MNRIRASTQSSANRYCTGMYLKRDLDRVSERRKEGTVQYGTRASERVSRQAGCVLISTNTNKISINFEDSQYSIVYRQTTNIR